MVHPQQGLPGGRGRSRHLISQIPGLVLLPEEYISSAKDHIVATYWGAIIEPGDETMKKAILFLGVLVLGTPPMRAQDNTFHITVLAYQWTTTHNTLNFSWPGYANTSCNGSANITGYVSGGGSISASGTSASTCSTSYTPPTNQTIDIQKPVVFIVADSDTSRMVLTCTRNVRWSQCHALNPGQFIARIEKGHFEVQGLSGKGKEEWVRFDVVQQTAIGGQESATAPAQEPSASIEAPESGASDANSGFPKRWKSLTSGSVRVLRFEGDYIYAEHILPEAAAKAGAFFLWEVKKEGDKYVGKINGRIVRADGGAACSVTWTTELTLVTKERIEGRSLTPPPNARLDWDTCSYPQPAEWQSFSWIPVS